MSVNATCNATVRVCLSGYCDTAISQCVCYTGYIGGFCEIPLGDFLPEQWLASRILMGLLFFAVVIIAVYLFFRHWVVGKVKVGRVSREMVAMLFCAIGAFLQGMGATVDPYRYSWARQSIFPPVWAEFFNVFSIYMGMAFLGSAFGILLAHWVTIKTAKNLGKGWNSTARIVFFILLSLNLVLGFVMSLLDSVVLWGWGGYVFFAYAAVFIFVCGGYIVVSGILTFKMLTVFDSAERREQMGRLIKQLVVVAICSTVAVIALIIVLLIPNWPNPVSFIWVRVLIPYLVELFCFAGVMWIFYPRAHGKAVSANSSWTKVPTGMKRCRNPKHDQWFPEIARIQPVSSFTDRSEQCKQCERKAGPSNMMIDSMGTDTTFESAGGNGDSGSRSRSGDNQSGTKAEEFSVVL